MFFSSIKEMSRLISKGMPNIYLKVTMIKSDVRKVYVLCLRGSLKRRGGSKESRGI